MVRFMHFLEQFSQVVRSSSNFLVDLILTVAAITILMEVLREHLRL